EPVHLVHWLELVLLQPASASTQRLALGGRWLRTGEPSAARLQSAVSGMAREFCPAASSSSQKPRGAAVQPPGTFSDPINSRPTCFEPGQWPNGLEAFFRGWRGTRGTGIRPRRTSLPLAG